MKDWKRKARDYGIAILFVAGCAVAGRYLIQYTAEHYIGPFIIESYKKHETLLPKQQLKDYKYNNATDNNKDRDIEGELDNDGLEKLILEKNKEGQCNKEGCKKK